MSKVGPGSAASTGTDSRRTKWARRTLTPATSSVSSSTSLKPLGGKRFVEPYRLSEEQRGAMLAELEGNGIGDNESRSLFAAALEYDLATCGKLMEPVDEPPPPAQADGPGEETNEENIAITALAQAAQGLAQRLQELDDGSSRLLQQELSKADRFRRSYGEDYLKSLGCELLRVASVAKPAEPVAREAPRAPEEPPLSDDARRFILRAADAFRDCFEMAPAADPDSPFLATLETIIRVTEISIPMGPQALSRILARFAQE